MKTRFVKNTFRLLIALHFLCGDLHSQVDSSAESFFPAAIGNSWHYKYTQTLGYITTLTRDSVANKSQFLFFDSATDPTYEVDSMLNVISHPTSGSKRLEYKLTGQKGETWIVYNLGSSTRFVARVEDIFWDVILGQLTQIKRIGYYYQPVSDTSNFSTWQRDDYLAAGFGFFLQITEASQTASVWLAGCVIDGKTYGDMTYVDEGLGNNIPLTFRLYNAYPNPFNPSTVISYQLPRNSFVNVNVYDMLGREVAILVNEEQEKGFYKFNFTPRSLSSGIYLVRMTAGHFTQTTKIIYQK